METYCSLDFPLLLRMRHSPLPFNTANLILQRLTCIRGTGLICFGSIIHSLYVGIWGVKRRFKNQLTFSSFLERQVGSLLTRPASLDLCVSEYQLGS